MEEVFTKKDFHDFIKNNGHESYNVDQITRFSKNILKSQDSVEKTNGFIDFASLTRVEVVNDDLTKSIMFWRPAQIEWKEIEDPTNNLLKSKVGYYKDTPANRQKGVVGKPYGNPKADQYEQAPGHVKMMKLKTAYTAAIKAGNKSLAKELVKQMKRLSAHPTPESKHETKEKREE